MQTLSGVQILWLDAYDNGPTAGVARYNGREHYFKAVFDEERDRWTEPRRLILYLLSDSEITEAWKKHRLFEEKVGTRSCYHEDREEPIRRAQDLHHEFYEKYPPGPQQTGHEVGWFTIPLEPFRPKTT
jgi:hypothetical protein